MRYSSWFTQKAFLTDSFEGNSTFQMINNINTIHIIKIIRLIIPNIPSVPSCSLIIPVSTYIRKSDRFLIKDIIKK